MSMSVDSSPDYSHTPGSADTPQEPNDYNKSTTEAIGSQEDETENLKQGITSFDLCRMVDRLKGLGGSTKNVLRAYCDHHPRVEPGMQRIAIMAGCSVSVARRKTRKLQAMGALVPRGAVGKSGETSKFRINVPLIRAWTEGHEQPLAGEDLANALEGVKRPGIRRCKNGHSMPAGVSVCKCGAGAGTVKSAVPDDGKVRSNQPYWSGQNDRTGPVKMTDKVTSKETSKETSVASSDFGAKSSLPDNGNGEVVNSDSQPTGKSESRTTKQTNGSGQNDRTDTVKSDLPAEEADCGHMVVPGMACQKCAVLERLYRETRYIPCIVEPILDQCDGDVDACRAELAKRTEAFKAEKEEQRKQAIAAQCRALAKKLGMPTAELCTLYLQSKQDGNTVLRELQHRHAAAFLPPEPDWTNMPCPTVTPEPAGGEVELSEEDQEFEEIFNKFYGGRVK